MYNYDLDHMIPSFPKFKRLTLADKNTIEQYTKQYPPYSDFNFVSLWSWSTHESTYISTLHKNLVLRFHDYITHEPFYTFIGTKKVNATIKELMNFAQDKSLPPNLKLIPEISLQTAPKSLFTNYTVIEDRDNFDYVYLIDHAVRLRGNKLGPKRNFINRFKNSYQFTHKVLDLTDPDHQQDILRLFEVWRKSRSRDPMEVQNELAAIKRVFKFLHFPNLLAVGVYIDGRLVAFSINEILSHGYSTNLFEKGDINFEGIFPYLRHITATYLAERGCQFLNHEQDLGIPGLRKSKLSYCPKFFLKKYTISLKNA